MHTIIMEGHLCALGKMLDEYLPLHTKYLNDPEVNRFILSRPPFTVTQQRTWLRERNRKGDQVLAVLAREFDSGEGRFVFVGVMDLRDIDYDNRAAESGSVLGDKRYWRRGIAREARLMQLKIAFDDLKLEWIYSRTVRPNLRSQRLLETTGYQLIRIDPEARTVHGLPQDVLHYRVSRALWLPYWDCYCEQQ